jgi:hypothetical protein
MHLIYLDESGNSGGNLADPNQPVFVLCALIVPESKWQSLEAKLAEQVEVHWPSPRPDGFEIHTSDLINPKSGVFRASSPDHRLAFMSAWLKIAADHQLKLVYRAIVKHQYSRWLTHTFGAGVIINPHVAAFALVAQVVNSHLRNLPGKPLGIFISDENHQVARDVDKAIRLLRGADGGLRLTQIIEKGFFIESDKSLVLQLCDLCAYIIRRHQEQKSGRKPKPVDETLWTLVNPLVAVGYENFNDVMGWLESEQKKERPGANAAGTEKVRTALVAEDKLPPKNDL